jgi:hypothetical protein
LAGWVASDALWRIGLSKKALGTLFSCRDRRVACQIIAFLFVN